MELPRKVSTLGRNAGRRVSPAVDPEPDRRYVNAMRRRERDVAEMRWQGDPAEAPADPRARKATSSGVLVAPSRPSTVIEAEPGGLRDAALALVAAGCRDLIVPAHVDAVEVEDAARAVEPFGAFVRGREGPILLAVTSFTKRLYDVSGRAMLESAQGRLEHVLVGHEGFDEDDTPTLPGVRWHNLDTDAFLRRWDSANADVIPQQYGGRAPDGCACPGGASSKQRAHRSGCNNHVWNRYASRWFRKLATLRVAAQTRADILLWIDCDSEITATITPTVVEAWLAGTACAYMRGERSAVETGLIAFDLRAGGRAVLDAFLRRYISGAYRKDARWEDSTQLMNTVAALKSIPTIDLAPPGVRARGGHVLPLTVAAPYVTHHKGKHGRSEAR